MAERGALKEPNAIKVCNIPDPWMSHNAEFIERAYILELNEMVTLRTSRTGAACPAAQLHETHQDTPGTSGYEGFEGAPLGRGEILELHPLVLFL